MYCEKTLVPEPRQGDFFSANTATEPVISLQHTDAVARLGEQGGTDQGVDAATDNNKVVV